MCFKNLPIEFDAGGKAKLKDGVANPYSVSMAEPKGYVRRKEGPGALVTSFASRSGAAGLPVLVTIVPGSMTDEQIVAVT